MHHSRSVSQKLMEQKQMMLKTQIWSCCYIICQNIVQIILKQQEANNFDAAIGNKSNFKAFENKTKILEDPAADDKNAILKNAIIVVPFKYRSNFWRSLEIPLINFKIELKLRWTRNCFFWTQC